VKPLVKWVRGLSAAAGAWRALTTHSRYTAASRLVIRQAQRPPLTTAWTI